MHHVLTLNAVAAGLGVAGLCSIPSVASLVTRLRRRAPKRDTYMDVDGTATQESMAVYSAKVPKVFILLCAATGCGLAIALAIPSEGIEGVSADQWLGVGAWGLLLFQALVIVSSRDSVQAYHLGIWTFLSSVVLAGVLLDQTFRAAGALLHDRWYRFALSLLNCALALGLAVSATSIPRRPDVYYEGMLVDRAFTVSAWERFNFSWPSNLLTLAAKKKDLDLVDLAQMGHRTRAQELSADWKRHHSRRGLWLALIMAHARPLALQWLGTLLASVLMFLPQWVVYQFLRRLETRESQGSNGVDVWMWVIWLGIAIVASSWIESLIFWLSWADLGVPIRAQLATLIFEKSMSRKDVKGASKPKADHHVPADESTATGGGPGAPPDNEEDDGEETLKKSKQSTVNLIGVDAQRVSEFASYQNLFPGSLFKLVVSISFLVTLLGWVPLVSGFAGMLVIMPVNIYFSGKYKIAQDRLMQLRDEKTEVVTEALQGIRQIKFSALEPEWETKIDQVRQRELHAIWSVFMADAFLMFCWISSPVILAAISLTVYAILHNRTLPPSVAFVSLGVFKALEVTLAVVPQLTTDLLDAWVSVKRIEEYLHSPDVVPIAKEGPDVAFDKAIIAWPADDNTGEEERFVLRDVTLTFPTGELSVISGKTGTGKSLLLSAILSEADLLGGNVYAPKSPALADRYDSRANKSNWIVPGAVAYVAQFPWIENASIKDNILFGLPLDHDRYRKTIEVTALEKDLVMLEDGGDTEVGANGINLSGGQRWRITLARAMYSRAAILILDDIFSAVDAHVGRHIFDKCLNGPLAEGRTRILVTHHVALCESKTKYLVELGDGRVLHAGLLSDLRTEGTLEQIKSHEQSQQEMEADEVSPTAVNSDDSLDGEEGTASGAESDGGAPKKVTSKKAAARKFVEEEGREQGAVRRHVYLTYIRDSGGVLYWLGLVGLFIMAQSLSVGRSWWLRIWTGDVLPENSLTAYRAFNSTQEHGFLYTLGLQQMALHAASAPQFAAMSAHGFLFYLGIYFALVTSFTLMATARFCYIYVGSIQVSRRLFAKLNFVLLRAPLRWLDTVPLGRILNRFTADFSIIDSQLANSLAFGMSSAMGLLGNVLSGFFVSVYIVILVCVLLVICLYYAVRYLGVARPVKRLESISKSPVFEQFGSALSGVTTIRGFNKTEEYVQRMYGKINNHSAATWHLWLINRWMGWRMSVVGSLFASFVAAVILFMPGISAALAGFALAFSLDFSSAVMWTVRLYASVELNMNAAERIVEYTEIATEKLDGADPPAGWPTEGRIEVDDLVVGYAKDLPPVLKGLSFRAEGRERVGVVGRTGAGKSSLTLALFRFLEARSGTILVDGVDIAKIKLHHVRSRLAIIPQDPVIFSGTIRSNLDPFDHHTDAELRDCLERVHLISPSSHGEARPSEPGAGQSTGQTTPLGGSPGSVSAAAAVAAAAVAAVAPAKNSNVFERLDSSVSEGGLNLSQGQRQLLCLARAMVSRPRVMVLDEATSAVDMATDALIQRSIREEFADTTLLVIAHRLSTIADFDRILVLSDGRVAEFGTPRELWDKGPEDGAFRAMCEESGERDKLRQVVLKSELD